MAQKLEVTLVDDLDGGKGDQTVSFGLDGVQYEIDLSNSHAKELREVFEPYVRSARKVSTRRSGRGRTRKSAGKSDGPSSHEVRQWARENNIEISSRGRVPADIYVKFEAAHQG
jgi:hypothetical protein